MEARFVSKGGNYSMGVREAEVEHYATGREKVLVAHLDAQFNARGVKDADLEAAIRAPSMHFTGLPHDKETEEHVSIRSLLGVWDSRVAKRAGVSDKEADLIIAALRTSDRYGLDFVEVEAAILKPPWPGYPDMDRRKPKDIVAFALAGGYDLAECVAYEAENGANKKLLELFNEAIDAPVGDAPVVITA